MVYKGNNGSRSSRMSTVYSRVERLIHLELAAQRVRDLGQCPECGKEHREWFEVEYRDVYICTQTECTR
jgi:hypothetical protein